MYFYHIAVLIYYMWVVSLHKTKVETTCDCWNLKEIVLNIQSDATKNLWKCIIFWCHFSVFFLLHGNNFWKPTQALEYLLWGSISLDVSISLMTPINLPWIVTLYCAVCRCYYDCQANAQAEVKGCMISIHVERLFSAIKIQACSFFTVCLLFLDKQNFFLYIIYFCHDIHHSILYT